MSKYLEIIDTQRIKNYCDVPQGVTSRDKKYIKNNSREAK